LCDLIETQETTDLIKADFFSAWLKSAKKIIARTQKMFGYFLFSGFGSAEGQTRGLMPVKSRDMFFFALSEQRKLYFLLKQV